MVCIFHLVKEGLVFKDKIIHLVKEGLVFIWYLLKEFLCVGLINQLVFVLDQHLQVTKVLAIGVWSWIWSRKGHATKGHLIVYNLLYLPPIKGKTVLYLFYYFTQRYYISRVGHTNTRFVHVFCLVKCMCKELLQQDILLLVQCSIC